MFRPKSSFFIVGCILSKQGVLNVQANETFLLYSAAKVALRSCKFSGVSSFTVVCHA